MLDFVAGAVGIGVIEDQRFYYRYFQIHGAGEANRAEVI